MNNSSNSDYLRPEGDVWSEIFLILNHLLILPILIGNIFVLIVYKRVVRQSKSPVNLLLVNLAIADIFTGLIGIPWTAWIHYGPFGWDAYEYPCLLSYAAGHIPLGVSCMTMLCIGSVRFINVLWPFKFKIWVTHHRIKMIVFFIWIYFAFVILFYILKFNKWHNGLPCDVSQVLGSTYLAVIGAHVVLVAVISTGFYIIFIKYIRKSRRQLNFGSVHNDNGKTERQKTVMVMLVVGCYYVCWIPTFVHIVINNIAYRDRPEPLWSHHLQQFALFLMFANSLMNPFIFAGFNPCFRTGFRMLCQECFCYEGISTDSSFISSSVRKSFKPRGRSTRS